MTNLRGLPAVDALVGRLAASGEDYGLPGALVVEAARAAIDSARADRMAGREADPEERARREIRRLRFLRHRPVINATGVLLHTNLGRAPLHRAAAEEARAAAVGYGNLEFDLNRGGRGSRGAYLEGLLARLTGAEAVLAVNNNAAALFLVLHTLAAGREVPVSRGELIEIGGSYRLPDLMAASGARLVEVGTTNRTRLSDYQRALGDDSALLLKVHPSNFRIAGFEEHTGISELAHLGAERGLPAAYDLGSGLLDETVPWAAGPPPAWLAEEPGVRQTLQRGADLAMFSGDKLFGGCQAGIIAGREDLVSRLRRNPLARALRLDGPTIAGLTVTAELYASGRAGEIPFWAMAMTPVEVLGERLRAVAGAAGTAPVLRESEAAAGAGSVPGMTVPSPVLALAGEGERLWGALLRTDPAVAARRSGGDLLLDLRAVHPDDDPRVAAALRTVCRS